MRGLVLILLFVSLLGIGISPPIVLAGTTDCDAVNMLTMADDKLPDERGLPDCAGVAACDNVRPLQLAILLSSGVVTGATAEPSFLAVEPLTARSLQPLVETPPPQA